MSSTLPSPPPPPSPTTTTTATQSRSIHHHARTRFYTRRVRDSRARRCARLLCSIFLSLLAIVGTIIFILYLALRPHRPRFHVSAFSAPGLAPGSAITFEVSDRNPNGNIGIYYDTMSCQVFYRERPVGAAPLLFPFFQPPKNTTLIDGVLAGDRLRVGDDTQQHFAADAAAGEVAFRLELSSTIRFRVKTWDTNRQHMHASCDVHVGPDGGILKESKEKRCSIYFG